MNKQMCLFHELGQIHFRTAFDLGWLESILWKTLVETEFIFSPQGADSSK